MSDPAAARMERLRGLVMRRTLHRYYDDKPELLDEKIRRRMGAAGLDPAAYLRLLERDAQGAEWDALFAEITVGETFFFRFAEQFAALEREILPGLLRARAGQRRLRIWSAGCSTGAEPYSVAILLHRLLGPALADWSVSILGTDLNPRALAVAREAEFGDWALRTLGPEERATDFMPAGDGRNPRWRLRPAFRQMVRFEQNNLFDLIDGVPESWRDAFDLVLCRNVLIYFGATEIAVLAGRLGECLAPDGWLLLGHTEGALLGEDALRRVGVAGTTAWRRAAAPEPGPAVPLAEPRVVRPRTARSPASRDKTVRVARGGTAGAPTEAALPDAAAIAAADAVRRLADAGKLADAAVRCRDALRLHPLCPELFFYSALLHGSGGRTAAAEADFRRAIYLDKQFVMAHYHLGLLLLEGDAAPQGRRAAAEAGRLAAALPADAVLYGGDGMTAGQLRALLRAGFGAR